MRARFRTSGRPVLFIFVLLVPRAAANAATVPLFFSFFSLSFFFWTRTHLAREFVGRWNISFVRRCDRRFSIISPSGRTRRAAPRRVASRRFGILHPPLGARKIATPIAEMSAAACRSVFASGLIKSTENYKFGRSFPSTMENRRADFPSEFSNRFTLVPPPPLSKWKELIISQHSTKIYV